MLYCQNKNLIKLNKKHKIILSMFLFTFDNNFSFQFHNPKKVSYFIFHFFNLYVLNKYKINY